MMKTILKTIYYAFLAFMWWVTGMLSMKKRKKEIYVLMYHAVAETSWKYAVSPEAFTEQIAYIARTMHPVTLEDIVRYVRGEDRIPDSSVALTFDDGYADIEHVVLPLLEKYRIHATIFLTTNLKPNPAFGGVPRLSEEMVCELAKHPLLSFQIHGRTHANVTTLGDVDLKNEILGCREDILRLTGENPDLYAYASGHRNKRVSDFLEAQGIRAAFGITQGLVRKGDDPYAIKRIQVDGTMPFSLFVLRLTGAVVIAQRLKKLLRK